MRHSIRVLLFQGVGARRLSNVFSCSSLTSFVVTQRAFDVQREVVGNLLCILTCLRVIGFDVPLVETGAIARGGMSRSFFKVCPSADAHEANVSVGPNEHPEDAVTNFRVPVVQLVGSRSTVTRGEYMYDGRTGNDLVRVAVSFPLSVVRRRLVCDYRLSNYKRWSYVANGAARTDDHFVLRMATGILPPRMVINDY